MARAAQRNEVARSVIGKQPRLAEDVGFDVLRLCPACLAQGPIAGQRLHPRFSHTRLVARVERYVCGHSQRKCAQRRLCGRQREHREDGSRMMQEPGRRRLRRVGLVEEAHGGAGTEVPLANAEPQVMVGVYEHPSSPKTDHLTAQPGGEERRAGGR